MKVEWGIRPVVADGKPKWVWVSRIDGLPEEMYSYDYGTSDSLEEAQAEVDKARSHMATLILHLQNEPVSGTDDVLSS